MKLGHRFFLAGLSCAVPVAASAASLPIDGNYGNMAGCLFAKTGQSNGEEDFILLTAKEIRSSVALCEIKSVDKTAGKRISTTLSCADEGEAGDTTMKADVIRNSRSSYRVDFSDGTSWGPFRKCK